MDKTEKKEKSKLGEIFSWVLLIVMAILLAITVFRVVESKKTGEGVFLLGYRPVLVLTGSMEPYMMTNGIALTKEVDSMDDIKVGDVVTYHVNNDEGKKLLITHRIIAIDDGKIYTKGDNNNVDDGFPLSIDNIEAKVVVVCNATAWLAARWQTTSGKIMLISIPLGIIFMVYALKLWRSGKNESEEEAASETTGDPAPQLDVHSDEHNENT